MIARPQISRSEWKTAERGAFGNFALFSCPVVRYQAQKGRLESRNVLRTQRYLGGARASGRSAAARGRPRAPPRRAAATGRGRAPVLEVREGLVVGDVVAEQDRVGAEDVVVEHLRRDGLAADVPHLHRDVDVACGETSGKKAAVSGEAAPGRMRCLMKKSRPMVCL